MQLSASLMENILTTLRSDGGPRKKDRRQSPRVGVRQRLQIIPIESGAPRESLNVWLRDISREGLGFIHSTPMLAGGQFLARLLSGNEETEVVLVCTIANCYPIGDNLHAIGASFVKQLHTRGKSAAQPGVAKRAA